MSKINADDAARTRFREEFETNFAVSANAGSGKTTAISERLAHLALSPTGASLLPRMVVVTFTRKAAGQMRRRAREALLQALARRRSEGDDVPGRALELLDDAFFGTIHSFCLQLGQRYGAAYGLNLNPTVLEEDDDALWREFLEQDPMQFSAMTPAGVDAVLRFLRLEEVFPVARELSVATARLFVERAPCQGPSAPDRRVFEQLQALEAAGRGRENIVATKRAAAEWMRRLDADRDFLPVLDPIGSSVRAVELVRELVAPLKAWLAGAAGALAGELALRYHDYRLERGLQTYADQVGAALAILQHRETLEQIRAEGYRVLLDEAQDTDPQQFAVLVEIARPVGAGVGDWPEGGGMPPRPGHFCLVGDGQQAIYGSRADLRKFLRHLDAFAAGDGGERLEFTVTFRAPRRLVSFCNAGFPDTFGDRRDYNFGVSPGRRLQVPYSPLVAAPEREEGAVSRLPLSPPAADLLVGPRLAEELRQIARFLYDGGPNAVGARSWGEVCLLAPRNDWLATARKVLEETGLKVALQMRRNRSADNPVYAWLSGLLAVLCDPENAFEWVGVLREVFAVSDAVIAETWRSVGAFRWDEPARHPGAVAAALQTLAPFIKRIDDEGLVLEEFAGAMIDACVLREKARLADTGSGLEAEIERLRMRAARIGQDGGGPREWRRELLERREEGRPAGTPADDAINLLTSHSAKGLEWPVVIPFGLWRNLRDRPEKGLRLLAGDEPLARLYFDAESVPAATVEARRRERIRELARLLYVTFTRARRHLILPWHPGFAPNPGGSFADLWGATELFDSLPDAATIGWGGALPEEEESRPGRPLVCPGAGGPMTSVEGKSAAAPLPVRLLPHQLAQHLDLSRTIRHESAVDEPANGAVGDDPVDYGIWWHEEMEFLPWDASEEEVMSYLAAALIRAKQAGHGSRAEDEIARLRAGGLFRELRITRARRLAELAIFAPLRADAWVDGVIDLAVFDDAARQVRVIDWKTNRARPGESDDALLARLCEDYRPQLEAYGKCMAGFFPGYAVSLELYATAVGDVCAL